MSGESEAVAITSIEFRNFKALGQFSVAIGHMNILVGPNNCGKSTILSSLRVLAEGLRKAKAKKAEWIGFQGGGKWGYQIPAANLPISVENVCTNYSDDDSKVTFRLSNNHVLELLFSPGGGCCLFADAKGKAVRSPSEFKRYFPIAIGVIPVLGPLEHNEEIVLKETVARSLATHRASRHFRNFWYYNPEGFDRFAEMVKRTWPGMEVMLPERPEQLSKSVVMFSTENRISRELYWSGFGFQIWCQLLTHISREASASLLVIDEPEIYLHPDVQRQLLGILREAGPDVVIATHSTEIMGEADPSEILLVDKTKRSAQRLRDVEGVQAAMDAIGSIQNITLTRLARNRRILFIEGLFDFKILRRFAKILGLTELSSGSELTAVESEGFSSWERVKSTAWGFEKTLGKSLRIAAIFDRDFFSDEEAEDVLANLGQHLEISHIHSRKEIENYLLIPEVLSRSCYKACLEKSRRLGTKQVPVIEVPELLERITSSLRNSTQSQYIAKRIEYLRKKRSSVDSATITSEVISWFELKWEDMNTRMEIVPGKAVLSGLRQELQNTYGINLSDVRIVDEFRAAEIPGDLKDILSRLDAFRKS